MHTSIIEFEQSKLGKNLAKSKKANLPESNDNKQAVCQCDQLSGETYRKDLF
jgi:hypothetical protein